MPKVSIVIPYYNGSAPYLKDCLLSIQEQTFRDFEIIVVLDDPFPFDILEIEIRNLLVIDNTGRETKWEGPARNRGLEEARGEYIKPLDADDMIYPTYLEEAVKILDSKPEKGLVYSDFDVIDSEGNPDHTYGPPPVRAPDWDLEEYLVRNYVPCLTVMYRNEGLWFNENMHCWADYEMWLRIAEKWPFYHISKVLAQYRVHEAQLSKRLGDTMKEHYICEEVKERLRKQISDTGIGEDSG